MVSDTVVLVSEIPIRDGEVIRVARDTSHGRRRVKLREWFRDQAGEWRPGPAGISIKCEVAAAVVAAILNAATERTR